MAVMAVDTGASAAVKERLEAFAGEMLAEAMNRPVQLVNGGLYLRGLLEQGPRKSLEPMVERLGGDADYQSMQQFAADSPWDPALVVKAVAERVAGEIDVEAWVLDAAPVKRGRNAPKIVSRLSADLRAAYPRHHWLLGQEPELHARLLPRVDRGGNVATRRCNIALGEHHRAAGIREEQVRAWYAERAGRSAGRQLVHRRSAIWRVVEAGIAARGPPGIGRPPEGLGLYRPHGTALDRMYGTKKEPLIFERPGGS